MSEEILKGGQSTDLVVRIGDTVHRSINKNSEYIHRLLLLLESKGYPYSPRFLGIDDLGREVLTFIKGDLASINLTDEQLKTVVRMLKAFHDATVGSELAKDQEVVSHNDLAPWNTIVKDNEIVGFIDFDGAEPGKRVDDLAYMLWTFLDLGNGSDISLVVRKIKILLDEYGWTDISTLVDAIIEQQNRVIIIREEMIQNGKNIEFNLRRINLIKAQINWIEVNRDYIISSLESDH